MCHVKKKACGTPVVTPGRRDDRQPPQESLEDIIKLFKLFDDDQTNKITFRNLARVAEELGETMYDEELYGMIDQVDRDGDGEVSLDEFYRAMRLSSKPNSPPKIRAWRQFAEGLREAEELEEAVPEELSGLMDIMGTAGSAEEAILLVDEDGDGTLSFPEFLALIRPAEGAADLSAARLQEVRTAFDRFDTDGSGHMDAKELENLQALLASQRGAREAGALEDRFLRLVKFGPWDPDQASPEAASEEEAAAERDFQGVNPASLKEQATELLAKAKAEANYAAEVREAEVRRLADGENELAAAAALAKTKVEDQTKSCDDKHGQQLTELGTAEAEEIRLKIEEHEEALQQIKARYAAAAAEAEDAKLTGQKGIEDSLVPLVQQEERSLLAAQAEASGEYHRALRDQATVEGHLTLWSGEEMKNGHLVPGMVYVDILPQSDPNRAPDKGDMFEHMISIATRTGPEEGGAGGRGAGTRVQVSRAELIAEREAKQAELEARDSKAAAAAEARAAADAAATEAAAAQAQADVTARAAARAKATADAAVAAADEAKAKADADATAAAAAQEQADADATTAAEARTKADADVATAAEAQAACEAEELAAAEAQARSGKLPEVTFAPIDAVYTGRAGDTAAHLKAHETNLERGEDLTMVILWRTKSEATMLEFEAEMNKHCLEARSATTTLRELSIKCTNLSSDKDSEPSEGEQSFYMLL